MQLQYVRAKNSKLTKFYLLIKYQLLGVPATFLCDNATLNINVLY